MYYNIKYHNIYDLQPQDYIDSKHIRPKDYGQYLQNNKHHNKHKIKKH